MAIIVREPANASKQEYDLIIIGGGIYGAMLSLEASLRGLHSLLLERGDFGEHTSFNSLRIIHGGLRYLQNLDLRRFRESVGERRWFLQFFPHVVKPLPCLIPLYGNGLHRPFVFRIALWANHLLSHNRNKGIRVNRHLPHGQVIKADQTCAIFPSVDRQGLKGAAIWYDAYMPDSQRLLIDVLRWACELGGTALNYVEARHLLKNKNCVVGVMAVDRESGKTHEYRTSTVVNAAGPWSRDVAARFDGDQPSLFKGSLAWNVLLDRKNVSDHAVAVAPKTPGGRTYFIVPWKGKVFAGTGHAPWLKGTDEPPMPSTDQIHAFLDDLNLAVPGLKVSPRDILRVFAGLLPATEAGGTGLAVREVILDHARYEGPRGLWSISGVKFTTARLVAEKTLNRIFPDKKASSCFQNATFRPPQYLQSKHGIFDFDLSLLDSNGSTWVNSLRSLIKEESVQHLDDLFFRRTTLWEDLERDTKVVPVICDLFDWDDSRRFKEAKRLAKALKDTKIS